MAIPAFKIKKVSTTTDIFTTYAMRVVEFPFIISGKPKNIASRTYFDETGDYEYIPSTIYYESVEFVVKFAYKGAKDAANTAIANFLAYLAGAELTLYSAHLGVGRQKCRVSDAVEPIKFYRDGKKDITEFSVKFKCNDPNTNITL